MYNTNIKIFCTLEENFNISYFLFQLEVIGKEVKQILPQGIRKHRRTDSNGSSVSSRSNPLREEKLGRSNTQRARSQLLETHLAKLFKQKVEIFTKIEYTQVLSDYHVGDLNINNWLQAIISFLLTNCRSPSLLL
jgi:hypothetical protein